MARDYLEQLFGLSGQVAVVIGGTGVLGGALCEGIAQAGAKVVVAGNSRPRGEERVRQIESLGGEAVFFPADVGAASRSKNCWPTRSPRWAASTCS